MGHSWCISSRQAPDAVRSVQASEGGPGIQSATCSSALCRSAVCRPSSERRQCFTDILNCAGQEGITLTTQGDVLVP